jgi:hypothetical protein
LDGYLDWLLIGLDLPVVLPTRMSQTAAKATLGLKNRPSLQGTFLPVNSAMKDNLKRDK